MQNCDGSEARISSAPGVIRIGTAGWSLPRSAAAHFPPPGTHLSRYARSLAGVELNSSFYRPHSFKTYAKWAAATPIGFEFALKLPRTITHEGRLHSTDSTLERFLDESAGLGMRRGPILVQLPPSLAFDLAVAGPFFARLRTLFEGAVVCEPRHASWLTEEADGLLVGQHVARAAADPPRATGADLPGGWRGLMYFRLHGAPRIYWSSYSPDFLAELARKLAAAAAAGPVWCIFDNTASGSALENARELEILLRHETAPLRGA